MNRCFLNCRWGGGETGSCSYQHHGTLRRPEEPGGAGIPFLSPDRVWGRLCRAQGGPRPRPPPRPRPRPSAAPASPARSGVWAEKTSCPAGPARHRRLPPSFTPGARRRRCRRASRDFRGRLPGNRAGAVPPSFSISPPILSHFFLKEIGSEFLCREVSA